MSEIIQPDAQSQPQDSQAAEAVPTPSLVTEPTVASNSAPEPAASVATPKPVAKPSGISPTALVGSKPRPRPAGAAPIATPAAVPVAPKEDMAAITAASAFGRVDEEGNVFVKDGETERPVGQFPDATADEAMSLYVRRYLDLDAKVTLFETRLGTADLAIKEIDSTLAKLRQETAEPAAVGDLVTLRERVQALEAQAKVRRAELEAVRVAAKQEALVARTAIVEAAEKLAAAEPQKIQWRPAGEELRSLLENWKESQRQGPRLDKNVEDELWKRFSHARTTFDRERRHFFAELEKQNASAKALKSALVERAQALSTSTDWGATASAYRDLMTEWKSAGRASRKDDDALWAKFRGAQDDFFNARDAANAVTDAEYAENLVVKEALLSEAEALVPVTDINAAKATLRSVQERWEEAGRVPRADLSKVEARLRAVENAIRDAEQAKWDRTNPETRARAEGAAAQLEQAIAGLEADLTKAQSAGNDRKVKELTSAIEARKAWLEQVEKAAAEARG